MQDVYIKCIETLVPANAYSQDFAREKMLSWVEGDKEHRLINRVYRNSGIETRYSVLDDFFGDKPGSLFRQGNNGKVIEPGTRERNDRYALESRTLAVEAARCVLNSSGLPAGKITHVITASCTGFANPGADYFIVRDLGLKHSVARFALGFMGCYAAIPALRLARDICRADPSAVVMVVSIELCSLHLHFEDGLDSLLANAIFADGVAAAIVGCGPPGEEQQGLRIDGFASSIITEGEKDMAWRIGNKGFEIALSTYVPDLIGGHIKSLVEAILGEHRIALSDIGTWAIHPGGTAILDRIEKELGLMPAQIEASRDVLRRYGNMSSATVLFVLKELLKGGPAAAGESWRISAMAFGPGLTVESAILARQ
ncbi:MAG: type III polyketide synthase [Verrucomicrobia bacterium]|nr:type III polyketide synthase [Verrucomicrobiota bacterium]